MTDESDWNKLNIDRYRVFIKYFVFSKIFKVYSGLWPHSVSPWCQCVYTMAGQTPALQQNLQTSEKSQHLRKKQHLLNTL